jgi:CRISPR/Cas system-associated exonuclease Cas4 (RecB family)
MSIFVSASSLADYISCSQKIYYRVFETGESQPTREMLMGTIAHKVLEKEWKDFDLAKVLIDKLCVQNNLDELARGSITHFIGTYFDIFRSMVRDDDKIEKRFKVKLYDDVYLVGVFDRISKDIVIDWKTNAKPAKNINNNVQFILYDLAFNLIYGKKADGLYMAALKDGSLVRYNESKEHAAVLVNDVIPEFVETVRNKSFVKTGLFNGSCYRCQYKVACLGGDKDVMVYTNSVEE